LLETETETETAVEVCETHYVFSWGQSDLCNDSPRGGSSQGADVKISTELHAGWLAIIHGAPSMFMYLKTRLSLLVCST